MLTEVATSQLLLLPGADKRLSRKPNQRSGKSPSRPGDTTKLEKQLPGGLEKVPLWPLILKRLEFLAEQEGLGPVPWAGRPATRMQVSACCPSAGPEGPSRSPQPCWGRGERPPDAQPTLCPHLL